MKLSLKFQDDPLHEDQTQQKMSAKLPITVFNHPFISGITTTTTKLASDFSFSLSTNFSSGPSVKLSYSPTASSMVPFSLSLKSGLGLFGSPLNSPLIFSANFSLSPTSTPVPTFFLHFKPQFGHFSLNKTVFSDAKADLISGSPTDGRALSDTLTLNNSEIGNGFVGGDSSSVWQEVKLEPFGGKDVGTNPKNKDNIEIHSNNGIGFDPQRSLVWKNTERYGLSSGVALMTRTVMPITNRLSLSLRWGVNWPGNMGLKMPCLTVNKIVLEKVEEVKENKQNKNTSDSELPLLKSICFWMQRDLENLEKENRDMKRMLNEMKVGVSTSTKNYREASNGVGKKASHWQPSSESSSEFERWRNKRSAREENGQREPNKSQSLASDVESELQKAIKAASS
ncbi:hypothetical protein L6164_027993 [Bauhinia variegata]|uniref:Uncharacterized protein n=1 Tax=Bauhinia variegata TaxID=167791 RepID=A0ACB9LUR1_BAUVA|nr:hypothetical protein L6164_027993 [Bauhinia variegata]